MIGETSSGCEEKVVVFHPKRLIKTVRLHVFAGKSVKMPIR